MPEAIRAGRTIDKIFVARGDTDRTLARILAKARENGIVVTECDRRKLDSLSATGAHQGIIAQAAMREYASIEDILERAAERGEDPFIVVCDEIADPHNLGAILRTAECAASTASSSPSGAPPGSPPWWTRRARARRSICSSRA